jgi:chemotaxis response regulator CheB
MEKENTNDERDSVDAKTDTSPDRAAEETPPQQSEDTSFPIVGIGASAGGLEAYEQFFANMPLTRKAEWRLSWFSTWTRTARAFLTTWSGVVQK